MEENGLIRLILTSLLEAISEEDPDRMIPESAFNENTPLLGPESFIDSLALVSLIVDVEQKLNEKFGISITIADERAMSQKNSPFRSVKSLAEYIQFLAKEKSL